MASRTAEMEYAVLIEREPDTGAVAASSPDFENVVYVGDPSESDEMVRRQFGQTLSRYFDFLSERGVPIPLPRHRAFTVVA
jgi:predicted RNase H-like HicB family nuclease